MQQSNMPPRLSKSRLYPTNWPSSSHWNASWGEWRCKALHSRSTRTSSLLTMDLPLSLAPDMLGLQWRHPHCRQSNENRCYIKQGTAGNDRDMETRQPFPSKMDSQFTCNKPFSAFIQAHTHSGTFCSPSAHVQNNRRIGDFFPASLCRTLAHFCPSASPNPWCACRLPGQLENRNMKHSKCMNKGNGLPSIQPMRCRVSPLLLN